MSDAIIPIATMIIIGATLTACFLGYFQYARQRGERLAGELEKHREVAEESLRQQKELTARVAELTDRVAAVEDILRSVG